MARVNISKKRISPVEEKLQSCGSIVDLSFVNQGNHGEPKRSMASLDKGTGVSTVRMVLHHAVPSIETPYQSSISKACACSLAKKIPLHFRFKNPMRAKR